MSLKEKFEDAKKKMQEAKEEAKKIVQDVFKEGARELFDKYPELESLEWIQYTVYFNDGDELYFSVYNDDYGFKVNDIDVSDIHEEYINWRKELVPASNTNLIPAMKAAQDFMSFFDDDDYKDMFDDHVSVKVTRNNIEVESYTNHG